MNNKNIVTSILLVFTCFFMYSKNDSLKIAKHYFKSTLYSNYYSIPQKETDSKKLGDYGFSSISNGFLFPVFTKDYYKKDSVTISNLHLLCVGNYMSGTPHISNYPFNYQFSKVSLGLRLIYNSGVKNVFFVNLSPFVLFNNKYDRYDYRYASVFVFNRTVNKNFSFRLGLTKTFAFGNRYRLPIIGFRVGPLDGIHLNVTLPRNISLVFPLGNYASLSLYTKPMGGVYTIGNDSLYNTADKYIQFARYELNTGFNLFVQPNDNVSFFIGTGVSRNKQIAFASFGYEDNKRGVIVPFLRSTIDPSLFISTGLTARFGKTKKVYNNYTFYDAMDMNATIDPADNNDVIGSETPKKIKEKEIRKIKYKDVADLIELQDIY